MQDLLRRMVEKKGSTCSSRRLPPAIKIDGEIQGRNRTEP